MKRTITTLLLFMTVIVMNAKFSVTNMKVSGLTEPLGIDTKPTFSWQTTSDKRGFYQGGYSIVVTDNDGTEVWNTGKVISPLQNNIQYEGSKLTSRTSYKWVVTVYDKEGYASDSETSSFETAFMNSSEWKAKWICAGKSPNSKFEINFSSPVKCRYVKLDATKLGLPASTDKNYYYMQMAEMEIYSGSTNEARTASVSASSNWNYSTIWNLNYLTDGKINDVSCLGYTTPTFSNSNQHIYVIFDLKQIMKIDRIVIYPRQDDCASSGTQAANFPASFTIQTSDDGNSYDVQYKAIDMAAPAYSNNSSNVPYYGRNFNVADGKTVKRARIYATALGVFNMKINGKPVTENKLEPGETNYEKTILYSTYDVTDLIAQGENSLTAQVAGGMFNITPLTGRYTKPEIHNSGNSCLKAELFIDYTDGTADSLMTDQNWRSTPSATVGSNWWGGEDYDARKNITDADSSYIDMSTWKNVREVTPIFTGSLSNPDITNNHMTIGILKSRMYEPLRVVEIWKGVKVTKISNGNYVVDFGRNFAGQYKFTLKGNAGQTITLREGETLNRDGSCKREDYYSSTSDTYDTYTFCGNVDGETWGPEFMYHGFRYLEIHGLTSVPDAGDFTAYRIRNNMEANGDIETGNSLLNSIHTICRDAIQSNIYNTVTDCPQREKLGWLDDDNEMFNSLSFNFDMTTMWNKVAMDCFDSQYNDGHVPSTCPHYMCVYDDDPNWGGSAILVPYRNYKMYGDRSLMKQYYPRMKRLVDYYTSKTSGYIMPGKSYSVLSDWGQNTCGLANQVPGEFTITTTYYYLLRAMSEMAADLGYTTDHTTYLELADKVKTAFNHKFYGQYNSGVYEYGNQSEYGMPLYYGLVDSINEKAVAQKLAMKVAADNYRIKTGEIGLKPVLMSLAKYGYNDIVYKMVNQTDYPSYGYFVKSGCTTTPEYWDLSMSQNHCMMDHIEEWFYSEMGGINNRGIAFDRFDIHPWIPSDMNNMKVTLKSIYGTILSSYVKTLNGYKYTFTIPENSTATITVPVNKGNKIMENGIPVAYGDGIESITYTDSLATIVAGSGTYYFTMGDTTDINPAENETFWMPVHSTAQLAEGCYVKIQEKAPCTHYNSYSGIWTSGRFVGYSTSIAPAEGHFITGASRAHASSFIIEKPAYYTIDNKQSYGCLLKATDTPLYINSLNDGGKMLSWNATSHLWGFDFNNNSADFYRLTENGTRNGNYVFFYDNKQESGVNAYGSSTDYAPQWFVYKQYNVIDSTTAILTNATLGSDSIFYERRLFTNGNYDTIVLPFDVDNEQLPDGFTFYKFSGTKIGVDNTVVLLVDSVSCLKAGEPYIIKYRGDKMAFTSSLFEFRAVLTKTLLGGNIVKGSYSKITSKDVNAKGKILYVLNNDGTAFVKSSDSIFPFRAYILADINNAPNKYLISINTITNQIHSIIDHTEMTSPYVYDINGRKFSLKETTSLPHGIYIINGKKRIVK